METSLCHNASRAGVHSDALGGRPGKTADRTVHLDSSRRVGGRHSPDHLYDDAGENKADCHPELIGAPDRTIVSMIVQQSLALGFIGFGSGALLIAMVKDYFPRRVILEPDNVVMLAAIVFAVCLISSGLGVRAALKVDPAAALGG